MSEMQVTIKLRNFTPIIDRVVQDVGLMAAVVYGLVWRHCQMDDAVCKKSVSNLAKMVGVNERTIRRYLADLCGHDYIQDVTPEKDRLGKVHIYKVTGKVEWGGSIGPQIANDTPDRESGVPRTESPTPPDRESGVPRTESPTKKHVLKDSLKKEEERNNNVDVDFIVDPVVALFSKLLIVEPTRSELMLLPYVNEEYLNGWLIAKRMLGMTPGGVVDNIRKHVLPPTDFDDYTNLTESEADQKHDDSNRLYKATLKAVKVSANGHVPHAQLMVVTRRIVDGAARDGRLEMWEGELGWDFETIVSTLTNHVVSEVTKATGY